jgi:hypothetical protein
MSAQLDEVYRDNKLVQNEESAKKMDLIAENVERKNEGNVARIIHNYQSS